MKFVFKLTLTKRTEQTSENVNNFFCGGSRWNNFVILILRLDYFGYFQIKYL